MEQEEQSPPVRVLRDGMRVNATKLLELIHKSERGFGWFAKEVIPAGTCVLAEESFIDSPSKGSDHDYGHFQQMLQLKSEDEQKEFRRLHWFESESIRDSIQAELGQNWDDLAPTRRQDLAIWACNTFDTFGVGLQTSRFNHSCVPNIEAILDTDASGSLTHCCFTNRPIKKGEELLISYQQDLIFQTASQRQQTLETNWGFQCKCTACQTTGKERRFENRKRLELGQIFAHFNRKITVDSVQTCNMILSKLKRGVRLHSSLGLHGTFLYKLFHDITDINLMTAQLYVKDAKGSIEACKGVSAIVWGNKGVESEWAKRRFSTVKGIDDFLKRTLGPE